jgi:GAF domain-containing protein
MSASDADTILLERRGSMYDPAVVDAFLRVREQIAVAAPPPQLQKVMRRIRGTREAEAGIGPEPQESPKIHSEMSDQTLALVSLAHVASQTPMISDVGTLSWSHIRPLVPHASVALFVASASRDEIAVRFAAGDEAHRLAGLAIRFGDCISGWAAATGRSAVNSDASLDLAGGADDPLRFALAVPLAHQGTVVGVLTLYAHEPFDDNQSRTIEMIAPHLAVSVAAATSRASEVETGPGSRIARIKESNLRVVSRRL